MKIIDQFVRNILRILNEKNIKPFNFAEIIQNIPMMVL